MTPARDDPARLTRSDLLPLPPTRATLRRLCFSRTFWALAALAWVEVALYQSTHSRVASSTSSRPRQGPRLLISSVL